MVSAFVNGSTPAWYEQRSLEVKSYVGAMGEQISAGNVNFNTQPTNAAGAGRSGSGVGGGEGAVAKEVAATSTSSAWAERATGSVGWARLWLWPGGLWQRCKCGLKYNGRSQSTIEEKHVYAIALTRR